MEKKDIINKGKVFMKFSSLSKTDFLISPIWVEYYMPEELKILMENGLTINEIEKFIFDPINANDLHPYYAVIGEEFFKGKEFVYVKSLILIEDLFLIGYQSIVLDKPTSCTIFFKNKQFDFFYNKKFSGENINTAQKLSKLINNPIKKITIIVDYAYKEIINSEFILDIEIL